MALTNQEKTEARDAIALALELNEPESLIEGLRRLCGRKANEAGGYTNERGFALASDNERNRWQAAAEALQTVSQELERANAPQARANDAPEAQGRRRHFHQIVR